MTRVAHMVALGGGTGLPALLAALKPEPGATARHDPNKLTTPMLGLVRSTVEVA